MTSSSQNTGSAGGQSMDRTPTPVDSRERNATSDQTEISMGKGKGGKHRRDAVGLGRSLQPKSSKTRGGVALKSEDVWVSSSTPWNVQKEDPRLKAALNEQSVTDRNDLQEYIAAVEMSEEAFRATGSAVLVPEVGTERALPPPRSRERIIPALVESERFAAVPVILRPNLDDGDADKFVDGMTAQCETGDPPAMEGVDDGDELQKWRKFGVSLVVPRRPEWAADMDVEVLRSRENSAFLTWRRELARIEEEENMLLTPFERNPAVWQQLWRTIERADVVVQIVDARSPLMYRCADLEEYVQVERRRTRTARPGSRTDAEEEIGLGRKQNFLLVNKADFLTIEERLLWMRYFREKGIQFAFFSALHGAEEPEAVCAEAEGGTRILGCEELLAVFEEVIFQTVGQDPRSEKPVSESLEELSLQLDRTFVVGLVGYPNVGKSSTVNALLGNKKVPVSSTPGRTKHLQTLVINTHLVLCDCPGLVFPSFASSRAEMAISGILPPDTLRSYGPPMELIGERILPVVFERLYGLRLRSPSPGDSRGSQIAQSYALARGFMTNRGLPDESRAARILIKEYLNGKLLYVRWPPSSQQLGCCHIPSPRRESNRSAGVTSTERIVVKPEESLEGVRAHVAGRRRKGRRNFEGGQTPDEEDPGYRRHETFKK